MRAHTVHAAQSPCQAHARTHTPPHGSHYIPSDPQTLTPAHGACSYQHICLHTRQPLGLRLDQHICLHAATFETPQVGAYSADRLIKPWPATVYKALTKLSSATGMKFIIGVNQHAEDPKITQEQVTRSERQLPAGSIVSFAVGNEPDMYSLQAKNGMPGSSLPKPANWLK